MKVMLLDDDYLVRTILTEVLQDSGLQVVSFADANEALGSFGAIAPPDVLVTDIDLGSTMTGIEVAAAAHALWPSILVVLISGLPANHTGQPLDPRDRYLQKPVSNRCLLRTIDKLGSRQ